MKSDDVPVELQVLRRSDPSTMDNKKACLAEMASILEPPEVESVTRNSSLGDLESTSVDEDGSMCEIGDECQGRCSFLAFRLNFLFVTLVVMLADGLQGTHLYVLYESYGFSVASLYSLGFLAGAITAPIMGPLIDKYGRKKAALLYCALEVWINQLEQYPFLAGLVTSRVVGGITTNLLNVVFEAWVDTEYRLRRLPKEKYETLMRDSVIVSNLAAIASGWLAHSLAEIMGPVGPFEGAVTCTGIAFVTIFFLWNENYGKLGGNDSQGNGFRDAIETFKAIKADSKVLRICLVQGLTLGSLQIVIFLWSPLLRDFAKKASSSGFVHWWGMDRDHAPAYGLIFGAYMAAGVCGGTVSSTFRKLLHSAFSFLFRQPTSPKNSKGADDEKEVARTNVELHCALCYYLSSMVLLVPCLLIPSSGNAFSYALNAFLLYEFIVGMASPCEGMIRAKYIPAECRGSVMVIPTIVVNVCVAFAVVSTEAVSKQTSLAFVSVILAIAGTVQLSLVTIDLSSLFQIFGKMKSLAFHRFAVAKHLTNDETGNAKLDSSIPFDTMRPLRGTSKKDE
ncbi:sugar transporter [Nitzschia inconspicua]|uniref:Sugar transporter n=1 Tax=Nitzschia inconspicua TaxID=303405 RepID=A0A9K3PK33_9STRA|nr:sugar transporter [Nitzschia inconspicua]